MGVPLMSFTCFIAAIGLALIIYLLWNDPLAAGHDFNSIATIVGVFGLGVILNYEGTGDRALVQVNFETAGVKWLAVSKAKLQPA